MSAQELSLEQRIGQVIMPEIRFAENPNLDEFVRIVEKVKVGGFITFGGDARSTTEFLSTLQDVSEIPLWICSDLEQGTGQQVSGATLFPSAMALAATNDMNLVEEAGRVTGAEARAIGIHGVLGPVVDLAGGPGNPIISIRAFGNDPDHITRCASAWMTGLAEGGAHNCIKHFPGHGPVETDSHTEQTVITLSPEEMEPHWRPYRGVAGQADVVMVGHLVVEAIDAGIPATASSILVQMLRDDLGFNGCLMTDALTMEGAIASGDPGATVTSGMDIALMPRDLQQAVRSIKRVPQSRLLPAVEQILGLKARVTESEAIEVGAQSSHELSKRIARAAVHALKPSTVDGPVTVIRMGKRPRYGSVVGEHTLKALFPGCGILDVLDESEESIFRSLADIPEDHTRIVLLTDSPRAGLVPFELTEGIVRALNPEKTVLLVAGIPWHAQQMRDAKGILLGFCDSWMSQLALCEALVSGDAPGVLPVEL
jgi:beta-glucosidase-like glycosyl hydrolase